MATSLVGYDTWNKLFWYLHNDTKDTKKETIGSLGAWAIYSIPLNHATPETQEKFRNYLNEQVGIESIWETITLLSLKIADLEKMNKKLQDQILK